MNNLSNILYNNRNKLLFDVMRVEMNSPTKLVVDSGQHIDEPIALIGGIFQTCKRLLNSYQAVLGERRIDHTKVGVCKMVPELVFSFGNGQPDRLRELAII